MYGSFCRCTLVKAKFCMHKQKLQKTILEMVCTFSQLQKLKIICTCLLHTAATDGLAIQPQLPVLQVKCFFNLVTNSCSLCCGCWMMMMINHHRLERKRMWIFVSPDLTNTYHCRPWFFATKKRDFGFGIKQGNQSINQLNQLNQAINQLCIVEVSKGLNSLIH